MKYHVILISLAFIAGCREQKRPYTHELHYPDAVITIAARETESDEFFELRYGAAGTYSGSPEESSGRVYGTDIITQGVHVRYKILSSELIYNDAENVIEGRNNIVLLPADVYLFEIKAPNESWLAKSAIYTGERHEIITTPKFTITIEQSEQTASPNH